MLGLYFAKRFMVSFFRVFLVVAALIFLGDFLEDIRKYTSVTEGIPKAVKFSLLRAPTLISQVLPIIVMLAAIAFSVGLARFNEFIISRAAGMSALKVLTPTLFAAFALGAISVAFIDPIAAHLLDLRDRSNDQNQAQEQTVLINSNGYWMRQARDVGHMIITANRAERNGEVLRNITAIEYSEDGKSSKRHSAEIAMLDDNQWIFVRGKTWPLAEVDANPELLAEEFNLLRIPTTITAEQILDGFPRPESLSIWSLPIFSAEIEEAGFSAVKYRVHYQSSLARPLLFVAMVALGMVFTLQNARLGNLGSAVILALVFGFGLHFLQNFSKTLGNAGEITVLIAAWFPALAALLLAWATFLHLEDG